MSQPVFDALPNLHAGLVHFPIGLLGTAVVADIAALAGSTQMIFRSRITLLYVAGTACLAATYLAGRAAAMYVYTPGMAHSVVLNHWNLALAVTTYFGTLTVARLYAARLSRPIGWKVQGLFAAAGLAGLVGLLVAADRGGQLVYRWGVGVVAR